MMNREPTMELMRLVRGELSAAAAEELRQRLRTEPALERQLRSLERQWQALDLPQPEAAPPGFATRVVARARDRVADGRAPVWWSRTWAGRLATALILAAGMALGALLVPPSDTEDWSGLLDRDMSMAESYLMLVEDPESASWQENGS